MSEQCAACRAPCTVACGYRCCGPCRKLFHGKCCLRDTGTSSLPQDRTFRCSACASTGSSPLSVLFESRVDAAHAPPSRSDSPNTRAPRSSITGSLVPQPRSSPPPSATLDVASFNAGLRQMEGSLGALITALSRKVDSALERLASFELAINDHRQQHSALDAKVDSQVASLSSRIDAVSAASGAAAPSSQNIASTNVDAIAAEIAEREKRKRNIIAFGLPEGASAATERTSLRRLLEVLCPQISVSDIIASRLGRPVTVTSGALPPRPRPLKVTLPSPEAVFAAFRATRLLRHSTEFSGVVIRSDRTPAQDAAYQQVRAELSARVGAGESGLRIVMRNGSPQIVADRRAGAGAPPISTAATAAPAGSSVGKWTRPLASTPQDSTIVTSAPSRVAPDPVGVAVGRGAIRRTAAPAAGPRRGAASPSPHLPSAAAVAAASGNVAAFRIGRTASTSFGPHTAAAGGDLNIDDDDLHHDLDEDFRDAY